MPYQFQVVHHAEAPVEVVWDVVADAPRWSEWGRFKTARLEHEGSPDPNGVGALRVFGNPPVLSREAVIVFDAPHHLAYELRSGLPIEGYRADVRLEPEGSGTRITWTSSFTRARPGFMGGFWKTFLRTFITDTAKRAAREAERRVGS
jgi:hypothetical protein